MTNYPFLQIQLYILSSLLHLIYLIHVKPFESTQSNRIEILNELTILCNGLILPIFTGFIDDPYILNIGGWLVISIILLNFSANLLYVIILRFIDIYKFLHGYIYRRKLKQEEKATV